MFQLALACFIIGLLCVVIWIAGTTNAPINTMPDWIGAIGLGLLVAAAVFACYGVLGWIGWGVPGWVIWLTGIGGVLLLAISWIGTFGDPLGRSPVQSYPFLVLFGASALIAAGVAGIAGIAR